MGGIRTVYIPHVELDVPSCYSITSGVRGVCFSFDVRICASMR